MVDISFSTYLYRMKGPSEVTHMPPSPIVCTRKYPCGIYIGASELRPPIDGLNSEMGLNSEAVFILRLLSNALGMWSFPEVVLIMRWILYTDLPLYGHNMLICLWRDILLVAIHTNLLLVKPLYTCTCPSILRPPAFYKNVGPGTLAKPCTMLDSDSSTSFLWYVISIESGTILYMVNNERQRFWHAWVCCGLR